MSIMTFIPLILVLVGVTLIGLGAWMSLADWKKKVEGESEVRRDALKDDFEAFTKLLVALKDYPTGQRMIAFGIVILIIAGIFGSVQCLD